jgi:hypothetical protein
MPNYSSFEIIIHFKNQQIKRILNEEHSKTEKII